MALIQPGPNAETINGSIAGTTFKAGRAGPIASRRAGPGNPSTTAQASARNILTAVTKSWGLLTSTEQAAWTAAANLTRRLNRAGRPYTPTGYAYYVSTNLQLAYRGDTPITTPPISPTAPPTAAPALLPILTGSALTGLLAIYAHGQATTANLAIKTTPAMPNGQTPQRSRAVTIATIPPTSTAPTQIITTWSAQWGTPPQSMPWCMTALFLSTDPTTGTELPPIALTLTVAQETISPPPSAPATCTGAPTIDPDTPYILFGDDHAPQWWQLDTTAGNTYTLVTNSTDTGATPTLWAGPACPTLTAITQLANTDAITFTAQPATAYFVAYPAFTNGHAADLYYTLQKLTWPPVITDDEAVKQITTNPDPYILANDHPGNCACPAIGLATDNLTAILTNQPPPRTLTAE
jgi:hypothetical protein